MKSATHDSYHSKRAMREVPRAMATIAKGQVPRAMAIIAKVRYAGFKAKNAFYEVTCMGFLKTKNCRIFMNRVFFLLPRRTLPIQVIIGASGHRFRYPILAGSEKTHSNHHRAVHWHETPFNLP